MSLSYALFLHSLLSQLLWFSIVPTDSILSFRSSTLLSTNTSGRSWNSCACQCQFYIHELRKKVKNKHKFCQTIYFNFKEKLEHMLLYLAIRYSQRIGAHPEHFSVPGTPGVVYWRIPVAPVYLSDIQESEQRTRTWYWNFIMTIYQN